MSAGLLAVIAGIVTHLPAATPAAVQMAVDIAHGEGGVAKVQKAVEDFAALLKALTA